MLTSHYGDHFTMYTNIKALCCTTESNIMLYVNISILIDFCTLIFHLATLLNSYFIQITQFNHFSI